MRRGEQVGKLLSIQMETHQIVIGSSKHFLNLSPVLYPYGENSRIQFLWEQCHKYEIKFHIKDLWVQKTVRANDVFIMDEMVKRIDNKVTLRQMNDIQLFLRVSRLSDITNLAGTSLTDEALEGIPTTATEFQWPHRQQPLP